MSPSEKPAEAAERGHLHKTFRAFHYRKFRLMWFGAFTSTSGAFVQEIAQSWFIYQLTNDPFLLGLVVLLNNVPILLFSLIGGVAADRMDRRKLLIGSQLVQMASALALAVLIWLNLIEIWHILTAAFFTGLGQAFGGPAYQALIPSLVDKEDLPNAVALMSIQFNLASVVGRGIGGVISAALGAAACFFINALSFLAVIGSLLLLPSSYVPDKNQVDMLESLKQGLRFVTHTAAMSTLVVLAVATAFFGVPVMAMLPVFAKDIFLLSDRGFGAMAAVFGAGGIVGALYVAWMGNRKKKGVRALWMQVLLGAVVLLFALSRSLPLSCILLALAGASILAVFASINSMVQLNAPEDMRGRIMSVYNTAFRGSMALGPPVAGYLAREHGAPDVIAANGAILVVVALWFLIRSKAVKEL